MSDEPLRALLAGGSLGTLATIKRDGRPQLSNVGYLSDADAALLRVSITATRAKTANMRRDPRVSLLVNGSSGWAYAVAEGTAQLSPVASDTRDATVEELVDIYRRAGCRIAIDDVGTCFSSADRIAAVQPDILKIDIHLMKKSASHNGYLGVLRSFSALAEQIGASLLIEGVETKEDLQRAIQLGARYVQGYLFAPAEPDFRAPDFYARAIDEGLALNRRTIRAAEGAWRAEGERLVARMAASGFVFEPGSAASKFRSVPEYADLYDRMIERMLGGLPDHCIRVYLCRTDGEQLSSNYRRVDGTWTCEPEYRGANWSWRPYFVTDLLQLQGDTRSSVSRSYADLDTRRWIRTISAAVPEGGILFFDFTDDELHLQAEGLSFMGQGVR